MKHSTGALHGSDHLWNRFAQHQTKRRRELWVDKWLATFRNAEVGCAFSVNRSALLAHNVAKLVDDLEYDLDMQFVFTAGRSYRFMRIS